MPNFKGRRKTVIDENDLFLFEKEKNSPLWDAYKNAFESMFEQAIPNRSGEISEKAFSLYNPDQNSETNWDWYVKARFHGGKLTQDYFVESRLYDILYGDHPKRLVYLHGHTGVGKSTMLEYFFDFYIPYIKKWSEVELKRLIPIKIPLLFFNTSEIEKNWDIRVCDFLYDTFGEILTEKFVINLARHVSYPSAKFSLNFDENGELKPVNYTADLKDFVIHTENRIKRTFKACDRKSVIEWLDEHINAERGLNLGNSFNKSAIQVLSKYYKYKFIFIVDNIDQLPTEIQQAICRLVYFKLDSYHLYNDMRFIIATRENFLEPIFYETFLSSYQDHCLLYLPPLPFKEVLKYRKKFFFDSKIDECDKKIQVLDGIWFTVHHTDKFIENVFNQFDNVKKITEFFKLSNHNMRKMLDIVKAIFRSPQIDTQMLVKIIAQSSRHGNNSPDYVAKPFIASNRIIDILVRAANSLIATKAISILPNIYFSGGGRDHYSSTLCRIFVLCIVNTEENILYLSLEKKLKEFGHPDEIIINAVNNLLEMQIIFSNLGGSLRFDDPDILKKQKLEKRDLTFGEFLLEHIAPSLRYMQRMSYITPLAREFHSLVKIPNKTNEDLENFEDRVKCASALYKQIKSDMEDQIKHIKGMPNAEELFRFFMYYGLHYIVDDLRAYIMNDLNRIKKNNKLHSISDNTFNNWFPKISIDL